MKEYFVGESAFQEYQEARQDDQPKDVSAYTSVRSMLDAIKEKEQSKDPVASLSRESLKPVVRIRPLTSKLAKAPLLRGSDKPPLSNHLRVNQAQ
jgi:hypothetical protein